MPELPEVETLRTQLSATVLGGRVKRSVVYDPKLEGTSFRQGDRLERVDRHGKWLRLIFKSDGEYRFHLRMTGRLFLAQSDETPAHARLLIELSGEHRSFRLFLIDPRRFATVQTPAKDQGPPGRDASRPLSPKVLFDAASTRKVNIKSFLLDQKTVAGIGNIYACEILYASGIDPCRKASRVTGLEWRRIARYVPKILEEAIACRGTSVSDWLDLHGRKGEYQHRLKVYGREGKVCSRCGGTVLRIRQEGRSTFYCPGCQK